MNWFWVLLDLSWLGSNVNGHPEMDVRFFYVRYNIAKQLKVIAKLIKLRKLRSIYVEGPYKTIQLFKLIVLRACEPCKAIS